MRLANLHEAWSKREVKDLSLRVGKRGTEGEYLHIEIPPGCNVVILCKMKQNGLEPFHLCLPHQVQVERLRAILERESDVRDIVAVPVQSDQYIPLLLGYTEVRTTRMEKTL